MKAPASMSAAGLGVIYMLSLALAGCDNDQENSAEIEKALDTAPSKGSEEVAAMPLPATNTAPPAPEPPPGSDAPWLLVTSKSTVYIYGTSENKRWACDLARLGLFGDGGSCKAPSGPPLAGYRMITDGKPIAIHFGPDAAATCTRMSDLERHVKGASHCEQYPAY